MSLWAATVITNILSAIPVFGQDIVELIWTSANLESLNSIIISAAIITAAPTGLLYLTNEGGRSQISLQ